MEGRTLPCNTQAQGPWVAHVGSVVGTCWNRRSVSESLEPRLRRSRWTFGVVGVVGILGVVGVSESLESSASLESSESLESLE